jgi:hypothetical protein
MSFFRIALLITLTLFLFFAGVLVYLLFFDKENTKSVHYPISKEEKGFLDDGDIILRQGYGFFSRSITRLQNCSIPITHCAMISKENNGKLSVIHSLSSSVSGIDGIQKQSLQRFLNESVPNSIIVVRFKGDDEDRKKLKDRAEYYLTKQIPFDHNFDRTESEKMYCTELFRNIFSEVLNEDIFEKQFETNSTNVYDLTTFLDTSYFRVLFNHQTLVLN